MIFGKRAHLKVFIKVAIFKIMESIKTVIFNHKFLKKMQCNHLYLCKMIHIHSVVILVISQQDVGNRTSVAWTFCKEGSISTCV